MKYQNTDVHRRVWPSLQGENGRTLELEPGDTVELEADIEDTYLKPVVAKRKQKATQDPDPAPGSDDNKPDEGKENDA